MNTQNKTTPFNPLLSPPDAAAAADTARAAHASGSRRLSYDLKRPVVI
jgi:hypothetical protein